MIGIQIANYRIEEKIGEGGMGVVYRAVDVGLDRQVAIKVLSSELARDPALIERFRAEAKTQANLNHTNIATLYAFLQVEGNCVIAMEYVEGETLDDLIRCRGVIPAGEAVPLFKQALLGIGFAHRMGIIHRDVKPSNIVVNRNGIVKVMDFGIAKVLGRQRLTRTGTYMGTVSYMSPEQIRNQPVDIRSDIYSLGVTLYEMLTAHLPFESDSEFEVMSHHVNIPPPPPTRHYPYIPKGIEQAVMKALEKNPDARFQTAEEFGAALEHPEARDPMVAGALVVQQATMPQVGAGVTPPPGTLVPGTPPPGVALATIAARFPSTAVAYFRPKKGLLAMGAGSLMVLLALAASTYFRTPKDNGTHDQISPGGGGWAEQPVISRAPNNAGPEQGARAVGKGPKSTPAEEPLVSPAAQPARQKPPKPLVENRPSQTEPRPKPADPSSRIIQNAEMAFSEGRLLQPPQDCALYWARQAEQSGNSRGSAIERQVLERALTQINAARWGKNYDEALSQISKLIHFYPTRTDLQMLKAQVEEEQKRYEHAGSGILPAGGDLGRFRATHLSLFNGNTKGTIIVGSGVIRFKPENPKDRIHSLEFPLSEIKESEVKANALSLHIRLNNGKNYNFDLEASQGSLANVQTMVDAINRAMPGTRRLEARYYHGALTPGTITVGNGFFRFEPDKAKDSKHHIEFPLNEMKLNEVKANSVGLHIRLNDGKNYNFDLDASQGNLAKVRATADAINGAIKQSLQAVGRSRNPH